MQNQCTKKRTTQVHTLKRTEIGNRSHVYNADSCRSTTTPLPRPSSHIFCIFGIQCAYHRGPRWPKQAASASGEVDILHWQRFASANAQLLAWLQWVSSPPLALWPSSLHSKPLSLLSTKTLPLFDPLEMPQIGNSEFYSFYLTSIILSSRRGRWPGVSPHVHRNMLPLN